jgi:hypothetical protein
MTDSALLSAGRSKERLGGDGALHPQVFQPYVHYLATLLRATVAEGCESNRDPLVAALDGQPGRELRKLYEVEYLRNTGTYFTGSKLASRLVTPLKMSLTNMEQVMDPACGAGDLLVACARNLPLQSNLTNTLKDWGTRLAGFDINSAFVEATRYRLVLLALQRDGATDRNILEKLTLANLFPNIHTRSGMDDWRMNARPSVVVVNPPFAYAEATEGCTWASGRVSQAASFIDTCIKNSGSGTQILAILPDVLRTGTRYERWRTMVAEKARIRSVKIAGQFDAITQISVFLLRLEVGKTNKIQHVSWARPSPSRKRVVRDLFDVHVGPVVPFRLNGRGSWFPYAHSEGLPPWQIVRVIAKHVRFEGTTYKPPFVVIRRTSKPEYQVRCIGTLVTGEKPIAIENHLLVAIPRDKKVGTCKRLLKRLRNKSASKWMNERIRCRHLTVSSVGDLPWLSNLKD